MELPLDGSACVALHKRGSYATPAHYPSLDPCHEANLGPSLSHVGHELTNHFHRLGA